MGVTIRRPVAIKIVLTEESKRGIIEEIRQAVSQISMELEQIEFQERRLQNDATNQSEEESDVVRQRLEAERQQRVERRDQMITQLQQIQQLPVGFELSQGTVDSFVEVNVGDSWNTVAKGTEIIVRDGVVVELRELGESQ